MQTKKKRKSFSNKARKERKPGPKKKGNQGFGGPTLHLDAALDGGLLTSHTVDTIYSRADDLTKAYTYTKAHVRS